MDQSDNQTNENPWLSMVLPCLNEQQMVAETILELRSFGDLGKHIQYIVADASHEVARDIPEGVLWLENIMPSRGAQLARAAQEACAPFIVFHHADNKMKIEHLESLKEAMFEDTVMAGAFHRNLEKNWKWLSVFDPIARFWNQRFGILYGDQSVFVRQSFYNEIGGIKKIPLMEDVDFSDRLRQETSPVLLDPPLEASMRRFKKRGYLKNKIQNWIYISKYRLGYSPQELYNSYYKKD